MGCGKARDLRAGPAARASSAGDAAGHGRAGPGTSSASGAVVDPRYEDTIHCPAERSGGAAGAAQ